MPKDILLDSGGDIVITDDADIVLEHSVRQDVKIRLRWIFAEWRFAPELGLPYYDDVFVKNPNTARIAQLVREEAMKAADVREVKNVTVSIDAQTRTAAITFVIVTGYGSFAEEVIIDV